MKKHQIIKLLALPNYYLCAWCKRAFRAGGYSLGDYKIEMREIPDEVEVSHGMCEDCSKKEGGN